MMKKQTAAELMENFITSGAYYDKKRTETHLKEHKKSLKSILKEGEVKRYEYQDFNMVAKFVAKKQYEWDYEGIIEYLTDFLVPDIYLDCLTIDHKKVATIEGWEDISKPFKDNPSFYVKPSFNKKGKEALKISEEDIEKTEDKLLRSIYILQNNLPSLEQEYELLKEKMKQCGILNKQKKVTHEYGSVSLLENKPTYDLNGLYDTFGEDLFLNYGQVNMEQLNELIMKGFINKKEIESFRTLKDIRLDFVVMTTAAEQRMFEGMNWNKQRIQNERIG